MNKKKLLLALILIATISTLFVIIKSVVIQMQLSHDKYALFNAAREGDLDRVKILIKKGTPINFQVAGSFEWTPLIGAIFNDKTNVVNYLVEAGADVNLADKYGETPLMWQIAYGDREASVVKLLIAHGADLNVKDDKGITAFGYIHTNIPAPQLTDILNAAALAQKDKSAKKTAIE